MRDVKAEGAYYTRTVYSTPLIYSIPITYDASELVPFSWHASL